MESLERRELLAGNVAVNVSSGNLYISGDNLDNDITITDTAPGTFQVAGNGGTTINGVAGPLVFPGVTGDVRLSLRGGDDAVLIDDVDVPDDLLIYGSYSSNNITVQDSSIGGDLTIQGIQANLGSTVGLSGLAVGGNLRVTTGNGADNVLLDGLTVNRYLSVSLNGGDDTLFINDAAATNTYDGDAYIRLGDGNDSMRIDSALPGNTTFSRNLTIDLGEGDQTLNLFNEQFAVLGGFSLRAGDGNNVTPAGNSIRPLVDGSVYFYFGDGDNAVNFSGTVGGRLVYRAGSGDNDVTITSNVLQPAYSVDIRTGSGDDSLSLAGAASTISGNVYLGGGTNTFDQGTPLWTIASPWTFVDGEIGVSRMVRFINGSLMVYLSPSEALVLFQTADDEFQVGASGAFGTYAGVSDIRLTGSSGSDDVQVNFADKMYSGNLTLSLGSGDDTIGISSALGAGTSGNVTVFPGYGNDVTTVSSCVDGNFYLNNQSGDDTLTITGGNIDIGGSASITNVRNVTMTAGNNSVGGNLSIQNIQANLGGKVDIAGLAVGGNFFVTTGDGADDVDLDGITVGGSLYVTLNEGDDTLFINHDAATSSFAGDANIRLGGGNDSMRIDSAVLGNTTFHGDLFIDLGEGDQTLNLFNERFVVMGNFTLQAGNGNNVTPVANSIRSSVVGNVYVQFGSGNNSINYAGDVGGRFFYRAGDGNNNIIITEGVATGGQSSYFVDIRTGSGDDTLTLRGTTGATIAGAVDLDGGTNAFDQGTPLWTIGSPWSLKL